MLLWHEVNYFMIIFPSHQFVCSDHIAQFLIFCIEIPIFYHLQTKLQKGVCESCQNGRHNEPLPVLPGNELNQSSPKLKTMVVKTIICHHFICLFYQSENTNESTQPTQPNQSNQPKPNTTGYSKKNPNLKVST